MSRRKRREESHAAEYNAQIDKLYTPTKRVTTKKNPMDTIPRRIRVDLMTPAELAIRNAVLAVEEAGCDVRLTDAVILLQQAKEKVADFVDSVAALHKEGAWGGLDFKQWWAEKGRLIDAPGAMAQRIMFAEKVWTAAASPAGRAEQVSGATSAAKDGDA